MSAKFKDNIFSKLQKTTESKKADFGFSIGQSDFRNSPLMDFSLTNSVDASGNLYNGTGGIVRLGRNTANGSDVNIISEGIVVYSKNADGDPMSSGNYNKMEYGNSGILLTSFKNGVGTVIIDLTTSDSVVYTPPNALDSISVIKILPDDLAPDETFNVYRSGRVEIKSNEALATPVFQIKDLVGTERLNILQSSIIEFADDVISIGTTSSTEFAFSKNSDLSVQNVKLLTDGISLGPGQTLLDHYEEGNTALTITNQINLTGVATVSIQEFVRIGKRCTISFRLATLVMTLNTLTSSFEIGSLPYNMAALPNVHGFSSGKGFTSLTVATNIRFFNNAITIELEMSPNASLTNGEMINFLCNVSFDVT